VFVVIRLNRRFTSQTNSQLASPNPFSVSITGQFYFQQRYQFAASLSQNLGSPYRPSQPNNETGLISELRDQSFEGMFRSALCTQPTPVTSRLFLSSPFSQFHSLLWALSLYPSATIAPPSASVLPDFL
jgi:hypothetical protein